jgi:hypothetical protein
MNQIIPPKFLVGVSLWTTLFFVGPTSLGNISEAWAQCYSRGQGCPAGYMTMPPPPGVSFPCDHLCVPPNNPGFAGGTGPNQPARNTPLCDQIPTAAGCPRGGGQRR